MLYCSVNGQPITTVSAFDRGLAYGDGVFTTAKAERGKICHWQAHQQRLGASCHRLKLPAPDFDDIFNEINAIIPRYDQVVVKVLITSGCGGRGYARPEVITPSVIITLHEFPHHYQQWAHQGISLSTAKFRLGLQPALAGIKHLNRLEQVMLRQELSEHSADDLVVTDLNQQIIETTSANLFWQNQEQWFTAKLDNCGVDGIIRQQILAQRPDIAIVSAPIAQLLTAEAMFVCNSVMGVIPVNTYEGRQLDMAPVFTLMEQGCV